MSNVTPFRRPKPPKPKSSLNVQSPRGRAVLVQALTLACFVLNYYFAGIPWGLLALAPGIAAGLIAMDNRYAPMPWARTHHEFALRTLIIGMVALTLISLLSFIPLGLLAPVIFWGRIVVIVWAVLRALMGLVLAILRRPIPNPTGLLI
jgi:uncharacterized membrane protein